jgi:hypothetical protein
MIAKHVKRFVLFVYILETVRVCFGQQENGGICEDE